MLAFRDFRTPSFGARRQLVSTSEMRLLEAGPVGDLKPRNEPPSPGMCLLRQGYGRSLLIATNLDTLAMAYNAWRDIHVATPSLRDAGLALVNSADNLRRLNLYVRAREVTLLLEPGKHDDLVNAFVSRTRGHGYTTSTAWFAVTA